MATTPAELTWDIGDRIADLHQGPQSLGMNEKAADSGQKSAASQGHTNENRINEDLEQNSPAAVTPEAAFSIWSPKEKRLIILTASIAAFFSPVSAQIYFPALNTIAKDLSVSNTLINLTITTYMVSPGKHKTMEVYNTDDTT